MMKRLMAILAASWVALPAHALLEDVAGTNYNFDSGTNLYWLDVKASVNLSFNDVIHGTGNTFLQDGWRYATATEFGRLLTGNLPTSAGWRTPDSYDPIAAPNWQSSQSYWVQTDKYEEYLIYDRLQQTLGGYTTAGVGYSALRGYVDRVDACDASASGCHAIGSYGTSNGPETWGLHRGIYADDERSGNSPFENNGIGHFLVSSTQPIAPVPEPSTYAMMGLGLVGVVAASRRQRKQAAKV